MVNTSEFPMYHMLVVCISITKGISVSFLWPVATHIIVLHGQMSESQVNESFFHISEIDSKMVLFQDPKMMQLFLNSATWA